MEVCAASTLSRQIYHILQAADAHDSKNGRSATHASIFT